jgi:hypothetical protein
MFVLSRECLGKGTAVQVTHCQHGLAGWPIRFTPALRRTRCSCRNGHSSTLPRITNVDVLENRLIFSDLYALNAVSELLNSASYSRCHIACWLQLIEPTCSVTLPQQTSSLYPTCEVCHAANMSVSHSTTTGHRTRWSCREPGVGPGIELLVPGGRRVNIFMVTGSCACAYACICVCAYACACVCALPNVRILLFACANRVCASLLALTCLYAESQST